MTEQIPPRPPYHHPINPQPQQPPQQFSPLNQEAAGFFRAGKVAVWVWIVATLVPIVLILMCCGLCGFGGVIGSVAPDPSPSSSW